MAQQPKPKTKREILQDYLSRPETPPEVKDAWEELDELVAELTKAAAPFLAQQP